MKTNLSALLIEQMPHFSKGQKRIAEYILAHDDEAAFMTALKMSETVGVSESTVVRFAAELGFNGYPHLQKAIREQIRSKLTTIERIDMARSRIEDGEVLDRIMEYDLANLRQTLEELPRPIFTKAVDAICGANRVFICGAGSCRPLASFLAYYFKFLLPDARLMVSTGESEILEEMIRIDESDVLIGLSFPRYSRRTVKAMELARAHGAKTIAITDSVLSPIAKKADCLLLTHSDMAMIVDSLVAPLSVINALIVAVSLKRQKENLPVLTEMEQLLQHYAVYHPLESSGEATDA